MKIIQKFKNVTPYFVLISFLLFSRMQCEKIDVPEIEKLPPATQTGADTFGCLVNGKALTPRGYFLSGPILQCEYQLLNGGNYFVLSCQDQKSFSDGIHVVRLRSDNLVLEQKVYSLTENNVDGKSSGLFEIYSKGMVNQYSTNTIDLGELTITHLNEQEQIISGTFWFDANNDKGEKVEVREGRFDMHYVK